MTPRWRPARGVSPEQESELVGGFAWLRDVQDPCDPAELVHFASMEERAEAWRLHRGRIMTSWDTPFRRPRMWWIERGESVTTAAGQSERLRELGELTGQERAILERPGS